MPVRRYRHTLKQGTKEDGNGVEDGEDHQRPDNFVDGVLVTSKAEKEAQNRTFDECQDGIIAQLLEEVEPQTGGGVELGDFVVFPSVVVQLED